MSKNSKLNSYDRARRAALLICHFARNHAYLSVLRTSIDSSKEGFWLTVQGNCRDISVLEWCKLFGSRAGEYHWSKTLADPSRFRSELLNRHGINEARLKDIWDTVKDYRDKFVAHLEMQETTPVPNLNVPHLLVEFYFENLLLEFPDLQAEDSLPSDFHQYYLRCLNEAQSEFPSNKDAK